MILRQSLRFLLAPAAFAAVTLVTGTGATAGFIGDVFYIMLENHNFTQPAGDVTAPQQLFGNPAAPYLNSLITPGNPNAAQTSYASAYHNVLATPSGNNPSIHPSEPNYIWQEGGSNFGNKADFDPYKDPAGNVYGAQSVSGLLQASGQTWKNYVEDANLAKDANGNVTYNTLPVGQRTVPLTGLSGTSSAYVNPYNGGNQYDYAPKHVGQVFFTDTNGGTTTTPDASTANPAVAHYVPLQQLASDLASNNVARYNVITPNQFNDMHSALTGGFTYLGTHYTGDASKIAMGDNFLSIIVPQIMASAAYKNNGAIVIWNDETEGTNANDFSHTSTEIVISPLAKGNAYNSTLNYTHSSDIRTLQELFKVPGSNGGFLGDAAAPGTNDLADLFVTGAVPANLVPEPASVAMMGLGVALAVVFGRRFCPHTD